ncbi:GUN4 domain protein [Microcystis aeruginosa PCC 9808]|uniref:GUN4 domain protein n=1 Tax=Microcystis aeruginosa PCC 9808 TaxID=1160284 RepID=I4HHW7_MICAE|nr:GUN4 domain-containing protein [Microcystis aeruginosa]CCI21641.1 GUN4 domain protein [Microcystis aeruginosa PCC 9808]
MANHGLIIGINQYQRLKPLKCAKQDAVEMARYCRDEINFEEVFLFTDDSDPITAPNGSQQERKPTYTNLMAFLHDFFESQRLETGDNFWFFFSGHGLRHQGQDYLVPSEGHPTLIEQTTISLNYVTQRLRRCGADNIILFLDACRNENDFSNKSVGWQKQQGVITIASCSPTEESYEIPELQQGSFTYSLLEALRIQGENNCATVERLCNRLRERIPEINRQHNKPPQTLHSIVEPHYKNHLILLPKQAKTPDIELLRVEALELEVEGKLEEARQLMRRVLALDTTRPKYWQDYDRINRKLTQQHISLPPSLESPKLEQANSTSKNTSISPDQLSQKKQTTFLEESPSLVCHYLDRVGLETGGYKIAYEGSDSYFCSSPYQILDTNPEGLANNIAYYVDGTKNSANELKIVLNVNQVEKSELGHKTLLDYSDSLMQSATGMDLPDIIKTAIISGVSQEYTTDSFIIKVFRDDWPTGRGYAIKFIISSLYSVNSAIVPPTDQKIEIELKSAKGIDYTKLRDLLKRQQWKQADKETATVMLQVANRTKEGWLGVEDIDNFPCEDLRTIDQLWVKYSGGRFGFSVQAKIYRELGGTRDYNEEIWNAFGDKVGWLVNKHWIYYDTVTFDDNKAPQGHLPFGIDRLSIARSLNEVHFRWWIISRRDL